MDLKIKGKAALVAGASAGLGLAAAKALFDEGAKVAMCSRDEERIVKAARSLSKKEDQVLPVVCDLTRPDDIDKFISAAVDAFGKIDIGPARHCR